MMQKVIRIFVNGILTMPGESDNWTGKAVTWCHTEGDCYAEKVEYFSGALFSRSIGQKNRAAKLRKTIQRYMNKGWRIILVGHSNGCDVILDALKDMDWPEISEIHLISGACEADFSKNGLNSAKAGKVKVYVAGQDKPLKLAASWVGRLFGYGSLGKSGPQNATVRVEVVERDNYGHSGWFSADRFDETMTLILGDECVEIKHSI